jgi:sugar O-acyltransferase (sialic acid O-acetyltransferase NeuD family)
MVPRTYVFLDHLPSLPSGKANRKALPNPFEKAEVNRSLDAATGAPVESRMLEIFREILHLDDVTPETDFLDAGGDSLSAVVLRHCIHEAFGVNIPMEDFHESLTPARLSSVVTSSRGNEVSDQTGHMRTTASMLSLVETQPTRRKPSNGAAGDRLGAAHRRSVLRGVSPAGGNLIIVGAGQSGRETFTSATQAIAAGSPLCIKGFLDDNAGALEGYKYEPGIIGGVRTYQIDKGDVFVCAIGDPVARERCCSTIEQLGGQFINIIHPLANIGLNVELGVGIVMGPFSSITCDARVGDHASIGAFSNVAHDTVLGDFCQISSHCGVNGCATLGAGVFLGSHSCILPGVTVGQWAYVGAGSIVVRDVAERVKVFGNPASPIGMVKEP